MTLVIIVLITVVTVGYLASVMLETKTAGSSLDQERAYGFAMVGVHQAVAKVREALGPWDDPFKNFATNAPAFYWSFSPGRITQWQYSSLTSANVGLFSESSTTNLVNLNSAVTDGSYPIIGGSNAPDVSVKWVNLPANPSQGFGSNNPIVGRYAFWVDSESAKINLNTADGTAKYTTNSLGIGSPTEVSLQAVPQITAFRGDEYCPNRAHLKLPIPTRNPPRRRRSTRGVYQQCLFHYRLQPQPGVKCLWPAQNGSPAAVGNCLDSARRSRGDDLGDQHGD